MKLQLVNPVCTEINAKIALSRRIKARWRLIGWGEIINGKELKIDPVLGKKIEEQTE